MGVEINGNVFIQIVINNGIKPIYIIHIHGTICIYNAKALWLYLIDYIHNAQKFTVGITQGVHTLYEQFITFLFHLCKALQDLLMVILEILTSKTYTQTIYGSTIVWLQCTKVKHAIVNESHIHRIFLTIDKRTYLVNICKERAVALIIYTFRITQETDLNDVDISIGKTVSNILDL